MSHLITLTTDFGLRDPYVASVKGVLLTRCPDARIVDLTHEIAAGDVLEAAVFLATTLPFFPSGAVHCAVIDPGVGANRHAIAARFGHFTVVCPDNGLLTLVARNQPLVEARVINNPAFMLKTISHTFHGRDVFAPATAALASGVPIAELGPALPELVTLDFPTPTMVEPNVIRGEVIHVDRFGNLVTNIRRAVFDERKPRKIRAGSATWTELSLTYADVAPGSTLALLGSTDHLEISVHLGSAADTLGLNRGAVVEVTF